MVVMRLLVLLSLGVETGKPFEYDFLASCLRDAVRADRDAVDPKR